ACAGGEVGPDRPLLAAVVCEGGDTVPAGARRRGGAGRGGEPAAAGAGVDLLRRGEAHRAGGAAAATAGPAVLAVHAGGQPRPPRRAGAGAAAVPPRPLVPKLCLGTHAPKLCCEGRHLPRSRASPPCVPKQSFGTRLLRRNRPSGTRALS